jgi:glycosyltransferase involved in cell wall biosynthesis
MKILQIAHSYLPERSGISEVARRLSEGLVRRGHEVHVATTALPGRRRGPINGVQVWSFDVAGNAVTGIRGNAGEVARYRDLVGRPDWDVRDFHAGQVWTLDVILPLLAELKGANVFTPHGMSALDDPSSRWRAYYKVMPDHMRQFDAVTCISPTTGDKLFCDRYGIDRALVIPNGVEPSEFEGPLEHVRMLWGLRRRPFVVNVSNHNPAKAHRRLFELARGLPDAEVVNIGNGFPAGRWNLGRFGVRGGCFYRCVTTGPFTKNLQLRREVARSRMVSALREADVFVLTSTLESGPLVILEAMAAGLPWVSFDVGTVRELTGGVVVRDGAEMRRCVAGLLADPVRRADLGVSGRARIAERYAWEAIVDRYESLYRDLMEKCRLS